MLVIAISLTFPPLVKSLRLYDHTFAHVGPELASLVSMKALMMDLFFSADAGDRQRVDRVHREFLLQLESYAKHAVDENEAHYPNQIKAIESELLKTKDLSPLPFRNLIKLLDEAMIEEFQEMADDEQTASRISKDILTKTPLILGLSILCSVIAALFLSSSLIRPIKRLIQALNLVGQKEGLPLESMGRDEIGQLGEHYNQMLTRLKETTIRKDEMEALIEIRTRDLYKAQQGREMLAQILVHDLSHGLFGIKGELYLMQQRHRALPTLTEQVMRNLDHMEGMVTDILSVYRMEKGILKIHKENFNIVAMIVETATNFWRACEAKQVCLSFLPSDNKAVMLNSDRGLSCRVLQNLLNNALRHTDESTEIDIDWQIEKQQFFFSVRDRGPGIKAELLENLFEAYIHSENSKGLGLGLNFCKMSCDLLGATVSVSNAAPGACFKVTLPL